MLCVLCALGVLKSVALARDPAAECHWTLKPRWLRNVVLQAQMGSIQSRYPRGMAESDEQLSDTVQAGQGTENHYTVVIAVLLGNDLLRLPKTPGCRPSMSVWELGSSQSFDEAQRNIKQPAAN